MTSFGKNIEQSKKIEVNTNYHTINIKDTIKNQKSGQNDKIEKIGDTNKNGKHHEPSQKPKVRSGVPDE